jgi:hypothetical protein
VVRIVTLASADAGHGPEMPLELELRVEELEAALDIELELLTAW